MVCGNCGFEIREGSKYCTQCGAPVAINPLPYVEQKQTFVVRKMPIVVIIVLTLGFFISGLFMEEGSMNVAAAVSCVPGIVLLCLIYKLDNIEPEPVGLLVKLFLAGGFVATIAAIGFDVIENLLYLVDSTADTAFIRAAFPGHCVFGIYMGYYYGQAKTLELSGDVKGAKVMRKKGVLTAIMIHGFYDFICFIGEYPESELLQILISIGLVLLMVVLNVTAYKNIKKFAYNDTPV